MVKKTVVSKTGSCTCRPGVGLFGFILSAFGIFFLVTGFLTQTSTQEFWNWLAILYYLLGIGLFHFGSMCKHQSCEMHGM